MRTGSNLVSSISTLVKQELEAAGMHKRSGDLYTRVLKDGNLGWLGVNRAFRRKTQILEINPVIGVRNQAIEQLLATLLEETFHPYIPPTTSIHLGYLMPKKRYMPWLLESEVDNLPNIRNMVARIVEFGFPFMDSNSMFAELIATMEAGVGVPSELAYRLPIAYALAQHNLKAEEYITNQLAKLGDAENTYSKRYRVFASKLSKYLQSHALSSDKATIQKLRYYCS